MLLELSLHPIGQGTSIGSYVSRAVDIVDKSGLPYQVTALGTTIEGDWEPVMKVVRECHEALMADCERVVMRITIDDRKGRTGRLRGTLESVEKALGRKPKT